MAKQQESPKIDSDTQMIKQMAKLALYSSEGRETDNAAKQLDNLDSNVTSHLT